MFSLHPLPLCGANDKLNLPCPKWLGNYVIFIIIMIAWVRWPNTCCSEQTDHGCCFSCIATMGRRISTGMCAGSRQKSDPFHCWQLHWGENSSFSSSTARWGEKGAESFERISPGLRSPLDGGRRRCLTDCAAWSSVGSAPALRLHH